MDRSGLQAPPPQYFKLRFGYKESPFPSIRFFAPSLLLHHFYFFPSTIAPQHKPLALYATTLNDERMVTLPFSASRPSLAYHDQPLPFALLFFLDH
jgi:hypothetical protein